MYEERSHSFSEFGDKRLSPDAAVEHGISGKARWELIICCIIHAHHLIIRFPRQEIEFMKKFVLEFKEIPLDILEQGAVKVWSFLVYQFTFLAAQLLW